MNTVVLVIAHQEMIGEGLNAEAFWTLELTPLLAFASHRVEVLQISAIEGLNAMVEAISDEDSLVLVVEGDGPWKAKLAICAALFVAES